MFVFALVASLSVTGMGIENRASAAEPGCYVRTSLGNEINYESANCPTDNRDIADGVDAGLCYVASGGSQGVGAFQSTSCDSFFVGTTPVSQGGFAGNENLELEEDCNAPELNSENCGIVRYTVAGINLLSGVASISIIASIIFAGYQYMTAQDNSGQIQKARQRIIWALTALALFIFMYTLLNWLVPGGVFPV